MKKAGIVLLCILLIGALAVPVMAQDEGCSLGFWKNHTDAWDGYAPEDLVAEVFENASPYVGSKDTLLEALRYRGGRGSEGGARILLRQAVAALLNAAYPDMNFPLSEDGIILAVNGALTDGDRDAMVDLAEDLDERNNQDCPLDEDDMG